MGWALNSKSAAEKVKMWIVRCADCPNAVPEKPHGRLLQNCCKLRPGTFYTNQERQCAEHPQTIERRMLIEQLNRKKRE